MTTTQENKLKMAVLLFQGIQTGTQTIYRVKQEVYLYGLRAEDEAERLHYSYMYKFLLYMQGDRDAIKEMPEHYREFFLQKFKLTA